MMDLLVLVNLKSSSLYVSTAKVPETHRPKNTFLGLAGNNANLDTQIFLWFSLSSDHGIPLHYVYVGLAILLLDIRTQARPSPPSATVGCNIPGDKFYLPGEVIYKEGCSKIICKGNRIQVWNGDCRRSLAPRREQFRHVRSPQRPKRYFK